MFTQVMFILYVCWRPSFKEVCGTYFEIMTMMCTLCGLTWAENSLDRFLKEGGEYFFLIFIVRLFYSILKFEIDNSFT